MDASISGNLQKISLAVFHSENVFEFSSQDPDLTLNTDTPDLTECFQQTLLIWIPCFLFWIMFFPYLFHLVYKDTVVQSTSALYVAKLVRLRQ